MAGGSTDLQVDDNPYDPNTQDFQAKTLPLDEIIRLGMRSLALELNVWRPAKIVKVKGNGRVDVQILLQGKYIYQGTPFTLPTIQDALVSQLRGADYFLRAPIAVGDTGIALFCDRSLDIWSVQGGEVFPNDPRTHALSDAVFIPGLYPFSDQVAEATTDLLIANGLQAGGQIRLQKNGNILIGGAGASSPLVLGDILKAYLEQIHAKLDTFLETMSSDPLVITTTPGNPAITEPAFIEAITQLQSDLDTLKSQYLETTSSNILSQIAFTERGDG